MDILLVTSGCLFQDLQLYDHIWLYDTIFYFHPRQRHINDCLSLYNAFPIFLGGWQHQPDLYDLEFLWISTHDCFKIWVSYDKTLVNGWLNKPEDFRGICVFLSEFDHLTMEGFPVFHFAVDSADQATVIQSSLLSCLQPQTWNPHSCGYILKCEKSSNPDRPHKIAVPC